MFRLISVIALLFALLAPSASSQTKTTLYTFKLDDSEGVFVRHSLIQASDGNFYGTAFSGGTHNNAGTIFRITPSGSFSLVYTFTNGEDGGGPQGSLIEGSDGNLYGTTEQGGDLTVCGVGCGTVFQVTLDGVLKTLHDFEGGSDGQIPLAGLVQGKDGAFYGVAGYAGGPSFGGVVFKVTATGDYSILHAFNGSSDGLRPASSLMQGSDGDFYGTTVYGGQERDCGGVGCGTIYKITPQVNFTTVYSFTGSTDGGALATGLVEGNDGSFYGVSGDYGNTALCSPDGCGTIFKVTTSGALTVLYTFTGGLDGAGPSDTLFVGGDGNFYGTAPLDGGCTGASAANCGTIFQAGSSGGFAPLYSFVDSPPNAEPYAGLIQGADGKFYGATTGAEEDLGTSYPTTIYSFSPQAPVPAPVQLSFDKSFSPPNSPVTLTWKVLNGFSATLQQCFALIQNDNGGAGTWTGAQTGATVAGVYSGSSVITPTKDGTYTYALTCGGIESGFATLTVGTPPVLTITTSTLPAGSVGVPYSTGLSAIGGFGSYSWRIRSGMLPAGFSLSANTGIITGTPTQAGSDSFTVEVSDGENPPAASTASLTLQITTANAAATIQLSPSAITVGQSTNLSARVVGSQGLATPTGTVQFQSNGINLGSPVTLLNGATSLLSPPFATAGSYSLTAIYSGDERYASTTSPPATLIVAPPPPGAATLTANPATVVVSQPGDHGETLLTVSRFTSNSIAFSCSGLPVGAACSFGKLSGTGSSGNVTLEIGTTAPESSSLSMPDGKLSSRLTFPLAFPGLIALGGLSRKRGRKWRPIRWTAFTLLLACLTGGIGCGVHSNGTPPGRYAITVSASGGGQGAATALTLVVQGRNNSQPI